MKVTLYTSKMEPVAILEMSPKLIPSKNFSITVMSDAGSVNDPILDTSAPQKFITLTLDIHRIYFPNKSNVIVLVARNHDELIIEAMKTSGRSSIARRLAVQLNSL